MTDSTNLIRIIKQVEPAEIYNLGAQSHVAVSFETPEYTANSDAMGTLRLLSNKNTWNGKRRQDFIKLVQVNCMVLLMSLRKMRILLSIQEALMPFRSYMHIGLQRTTVMHMVFLLAMASYLITKVQEEVETFVTRKITRGLSMPDLGIDDCLYLGNLNAKRDWGTLKTMLRSNG